MGFLKEAVVAGKGRSYRKESREYWLETS